MFDTLDEHDELERTDNEEQPDTFHEYETPDEFDITIAVAPDFGEALVQLWDNVDDRWKREGKHRLAKSGWVPVDRVETIVLNMVEGRKHLQAAKHDEPMPDTS